MLIYTGIGSRHTPKEILEQMRHIAEQLAESGWTLRSGAAPGADTAFEEGCDAFGGNKEIYIPWNGFSNRTWQQSGVIAGVSVGATSMAATTHPNWEACSRGARMLHARNMYQILGQDLHTPTKLVICWTRDGKGGGGTGQAIRLAKHQGIPVFDLGDPSWEIRERLTKLVEFLERD